MGSEYKIKWTTEADLAAGEQLLEQQQKIAELNKSITDVEGKMTAERQLGNETVKQTTTVLETHGTQVANVTGKKSALGGVMRGLSREFPILGMAIRALSNHWVILGVAIASTIAAIRNYIKAQEELETTSRAQENIKNEIKSLEILKREYAAVDKAESSRLQKIKTEADDAAQALAKLNVQLQFTAVLQGRKEEVEKALRDFDIERRLREGQITPEQAEREKLAEGLKELTRQKDAELNEQWNKTQRIDATRKRAEDEERAATAAKVAAEDEAAKRATDLETQQKLAAEEGTGLPSIKKALAENKKQQMALQNIPLAESILEPGSEAYQARFKELTAKGFDAAYLIAVENEQNQYARQPILDLLQNEAGLLKQQANIQKQLVDAEAKKKEADEAVVEPKNKAAKAAEQTKKFTDEYNAELFKHRELASKLGAIYKAKTDLLRQQSALAEKELAEATVTTLMESKFAQIDARSKLRSPNLRAIFTSAPNVLEGIRRLRQAYPQLSAEDEQALSGISPLPARTQELQEAWTKENMPGTPTPRPPASRAPRTWQKLSWKEMTGRDWGETSAPQGNLGGPYGLGPVDPRTVKNLNGAMGRFTGATIEALQTMSSQLNAATNEVNQIKARQANRQLP